AKTLIAPILIGKGFLYTLITPNVVRAETEERIVVEAHGLNVPTEVTVSVYDFPQKKNVLYMVKAALNTNNNMLASPSIKVLPPSSLLPLEKNAQFTMEKVVLVSPQSGYIFLQTDKTIYTPGSAVRYRVFSLGHNLELMDKTVITEFKVKVTCASMCGGHYLNSLGTWQVVAKYEDSPEFTFSTPFDVKEYVLPSFEVTLNPSETFLYIDDNKDFRVSITANFLYGKKVEGVAFVIFGVKIDDEKKSIPDSLKRIPIVEGDGEAVLTKAMLRTKFRNLNELIGHSLYISATVMTDSGSDMVVAERTGISIVTSPYQIHFTKTPKYFKPGMPYELMVYVTNPDGSPADLVPVVSEPIRVESTTQSDGTAKLILNVPANSRELRITVRTKHERLPEERQAVKTMVATAYETQGGSGNYLHLAVTAVELQAGSNLPINFNVKGNSQAVLDQIHYFTYIILTKGKVFKVGRQNRAPGQNLVSMSLPITPDLIPSFRFLAYYVLGNNELVADSVWVDVKDTCMGTLVVKGATERDNRIHEPGAQMKIKLEGDANARVGLVAVDKGVYVLNKKHKLTQAKVWDTVEKSDIGCTAGSGRNNLGVFEDAGLALETNVKLSTKQRSEIKCPQLARRKRSSIQLLETKQNKAAQYQDQQLRKCCEDGMRDNPMGHSCEKRTRYIDDQHVPECQNVFLECCHYIRDIRHTLQRDDQLFLARSETEDEFLSDEQIVSRTEFPESWLWQMEHLTAPANDQGISSKVVPFYLKDSITTWEVLAVSISDTKGICVADPYEITVMKDFFIDLRLPYSVVRNEQVEIRGVIYNYVERDIKVRVELIHNPAFCSASTAKQRYQHVLNIKGMSSIAVPFVIVPLKMGLHDVEVKAAVWGQYVSDGVKKKLRVVVRKSDLPMALGEEERRIPEQECNVLFKVTKRGNGVQQQKVDAKLLENMVPDTEPDTKITVQGDPVAQIIEDSIDGTKLNHLIITPSGCGEQNMITMTPSVIATIYLDATGQWEKIGVDRRSVAVNQIMQGYTQQLVYKKADHSYAAFTGRKASTWLTAYIVKVFSMASRIVNTVNRDIICGGVKWLVLERQKPDGIFHEEAPVIHGEMVGGYKGAEPEVSLTAFVLVALLESKEICKDQVNSLPGAINKATAFLSRKYDTLQRPYTTALTAYALVLAGQLKDDRVLMAASTGRNRWEEYNARTYNLEGTSYALLALLKLRLFDTAGPVVRWLVQQKYYGGTYGQTQATIMVFQALAEYEMNVPTHKDLNLDVSIKLPERAEPVRFRIDYERALLSRTTETKLNDGFTVQASGQGKATMTVVTEYHEKLREDASRCKKFNLDVTVKILNLSVSIRICTRYLDDKVDATMTIIDVSMLTGFAPDTGDLKRLSEGVDRYISKFEIDNVVSERGNVIIYLDKVSHREDECLEFKAYQYFSVGLIQPASVRVYSYYNLDEQCVKFYHPEKGSGLLSKICHGDVCRCAEENCSLLNKLEPAVDLQIRTTLACKPNVDFGNCLSYRNLSQPCIKYFLMFYLISPGSDPDPQASPRIFISQLKCRTALNLEQNKDYLVWGPSADMWPTKSGIQYIISKDTWIEKWPNDEECQDEEFQNLCNDFIHFSTTLSILGCQA
uniref:Complement C3 n=1 Tax=Varanus komodoensis TaxID=61221 RepID=A0A8D2LCJ6_VARKO